MQLQLSMWCCSKGKLLTVIAVHQLCQPQSRDELLRNSWVRQACRQKLGPSLVQKNPILPA